MERFRQMLSLHNYFFNVMQWQHIDNTGQPGGWNITFTVGGDTIFFQKKLGRLQVDYSCCKQELSFKTPPWPADQSQPRRIIGQMNPYQRNRYGCVKSTSCTSKVLSGINDLSAVPLCQMGSEDLSAAILKYKQAALVIKQLQVACFPFDNVRISIPKFEQQRWLVIKVSLFLIGCGTNAHLEVWGSYDIKFVTKHYSNSLSKAVKSRKVISITAVSRNTTMGISN